MDELASSYLDTLTFERNLSKNTVKAYREDLQEYAAWSAREGIDPLNPSKRGVRMYLAYLDQAGYTRRTVNRRLSALKGFFGWACARGSVEVDPVSSLHGPKSEKHLPKVIPLPRWTGSSRFMARWRRGVRTCCSGPRSSGTKPCWR